MIDRTIKIVGEFPDFTVTCECGQREEAEMNYPTDAAELISWITSHQCGRTSPEYVGRHRYPASV